VVIIDSSVWIDYFRGVSNGEVDWVDRELANQRLAITDLILCEVLQGVRGKAAFELALADLRLCEVLNTGGVELAVAAARNFLLLRERGYTVRKTIDCLIATYCLQENHELLHRDRDFDVFESELGLRVVHA
jgi:predicted nucleic acid-binding protein